MASDADPMTVWAIRLTKRARADAEAAEERIAEIAGEDIAEAWGKGLETETAKLAELPTRWPIAEEDKLFRESVRRMLYRRTPSGPVYRILFVLRESPDDAPTVAIIHIRHAAQKPMTRKEARGIEAAV